MNDNGNTNNNSPTNNQYGARPSVNLKSNIQIVSGEGTKESPFEIEM